MIPALGSKWPGKLFSYFRVQVGAALAIHQVFVAVSEHFLSRGPAGRAILSANET